ncbi:predicted protein [Coccidioides posadasii str. Silveira]|uniref:Predicted protein n=1 Tax=Coccidioides posadasii (strain RMSCC 757 / Silveira) TaxID=443226 RepID=E9DCR5_COCPS|nr:predicted protein [Coccidioides posadasii str. Silveira]
MLTIINEDLSVFTVLCHIIDEEADEKFLMNEFNFGKDHFKSTDTMSIFSVNKN